LARAPDPTSSSWLNQVERFFALLTDKKIRRGIRSVAALRADITSFIGRHNADPKPFRWTKSADDILASIERFCRYNTPQNKIRYPELLVQDTSASSHRWDTLDQMVGGCTWPDDLERPRCALSLGPFYILSATVIRFAQDT
jgi:hypothetical protein